MSENLKLHIKKQYNMPQEERENISNKPVDTDNMVIASSLLNHSGGEKGLNLSIRLKERLSLTNLFLPLKKESKKLLIKDCFWGILSLTYRLLYTMVRIMTLIL